MKISFINPPIRTSFPQPPLGLALLAAIAEKSGASVRLFDGTALGFSNERLAREASGSDVVCMGAMTSSLSSAFSLAKEVKKLNPGAIVVLGGPHASILPKETLRECDAIDIVVKGEGEGTIAELVKCEFKRLGKISGLAFRDNGKITETPDRPLIHDLDSLPFPAYNLLDLRKYRPYPPHGKSLPFMPMLTSRGCPFKCVYCSKPVFGNRFRTQSPKRVMEELAYLKEKLGVREVMFYDDSFSLDQKRTAELCKMMLEGKLGLPWSCETRVNLVSPELLGLMKKAGCYMISYGVESGSPKILANLRKGITVEQVEKAFSETRKAGIKTVAYFMLGSPGETQETVDKTIAFSQSIGADFAQFSVCTPLPGSELFSMVKDKMKGADWSSFNYADITRLDTSLLFGSEIKDIAAQTRKAYTSFYLRPGYLAGRLFGMRSLEDVKMNLNGLRMLKSMMG